jgi:hypothetical protein
VTKTTTPPAKKSTTPPVTKTTNPPGKGAVVAAGPAGGRSPPAD